MNRMRVLAYICALSLLGVSDASAQWKIDKSQLQKAVGEKIAKEEGGSKGKKRRRGGDSDSVFKKKPQGGGWGALKGQWGGGGVGKKPQRNTGWGALGGGFQAPARGGGVGQQIKQAIVKKKITVITGKRVTDAVTGELLDDAREIRIFEEDKDEYFDDGTHGDVVAGDGQYTRIEEITGVIGPNNQRIKEQLIQALYEASRLPPTEFYGHTLMKADLSTRPERNVRWALVEAPEGNVGSRMVEIATEKSVEVPDYWTEEASRDEKIAGDNGWAKTFLDEFRLVKGEINSNFYRPYVPEPPTIPKIRPPEAEGWSPYTGEGGFGSGAGAGAGGGGGALPAGGGGGWFKPRGGAQGAAAAFVNRGAGQGSTSGGYFSAQ